MNDLLGLPTQWIVQGGAVGMLGLVAILVFTGRLIPRSIYRQLEQDRDYWREAALRSMGQATDLLPGARIAAEVTAAFHKATKSEVEE